MQLLLATRKLALKEPSSGRKGDRLRWKEPARQETVRSFLNSDIFFVAHSPSGGTPPSLDVLLAKLDRCLQHDSRREPLTNTSFANLYTFYFTGTAYIEPRHYGGVFVLQ